MKKMIIPLTALFAVMLVSCDILPGFNLLKPDDLITLEEDSFYAQNMITDKFYVVKAEILWESEKCVIWAEKDSGVTRRQARAIANEYETVISTVIVENFSKKNFSVIDRGESYQFDDILDYADWLTDNDGKLTILLLDIKDGFKNQQTDSYIAGYFFGGNFYSKGKINSQQYSNGRDMIYLDTNPGLQNYLTQTYTTFAHELQHLINYVTTVQTERGAPMDIWIDEGLSSQAEFFYLGENPRDKCEWFSKDQNGTIARGNNFFIWDNHKEKSLTVLDDYSTVFLFFRWLYLQAYEELQSSIFYDIITSHNVDYRAVTATTGKIDSSWDNWETLLRTWYAANYFPKNAVYGYKGDSYLQETIKVNPVPGKSISLYPGEGVFSIINDSFTHANGINIRYAGLAVNTTAINVSSPYRGDVLLTFNANVSNTEITRPETGYLTGVPPPVSRSLAENTQSKITGPYVLDARDVLRRNIR